MSNSATAPAAPVPAGVADPLSGGPLDRSASAVARAAAPVTVPGGRRTGAAGVPGGGGTAGAAGHPTCRHRRGAAAWTAGPPATADGPVTAPGPVVNDDIALPAPSVPATDQTDHPAQENRCPTDI
ncbi:hypothetical protein GCM10010420_44450 [Streptomyces glaucosporus]|uniref:Uncharacterized protein n=1 Tax=Streptomyces glaucosporus TaxID=284044 RepID=A0ABN3IPP6_9ACTN